MDIFNTKDPEAVGLALPSRQANKRILGVDLGTHCGLAFIDYNPEKPMDRQIMLAGQLDLSLGEYDTGPMRHIRLKQFLNICQPDLIGFEEVRFTPKLEGLEGGPVGVIVARVATAAEFLGSLKIILSVWAEERGVPATGFGIGAIKKAATNKGNANKIDMIKAANKAFGVELSADDYHLTGHDNVADAMWVCKLTADNYWNGLR